MPTLARAQPFIESFDDPERFQQMWLPIGVGADPPRPWDPAQLDISSGSLHINTENTVPLSEICPLGDPTCWDTGNNATTGIGWLPSLAQPVSDVTVQTKVRIDTLTNSAIGLRADLATASNYNITYAGADGTWAMSRFNNGVMDRVEFFDDLPVNVGEDWHVVASAIGNRIGFKAWKDGTPEPEQPQHIWTDDLHSAGGIALAGTVHNNTIPEPTKLDTTFDDVIINVLDLPQLPAEFTDSEFADFSVCPLGLPGNSSWCVLDGSVLDGNLVLREVAEAWGPAIIDTSNGTLNLQSTNSVPLANPDVYPIGDKTVFPFENFGFMNPIWAPSVEVPVADATVRTKLKVDTDSQAAVLMRFTGPSGYAFTMSGATDEIILGLFEDGVMTEVETAPGMDFQNGENAAFNQGLSGEQGHQEPWRLQ